MRKIKKCIGLLLAIALAGNLCAVNIPVSEVYDFWKIGGV